MHVTLRQLNVFHAVARHRSFTRAAEELHLSQPAVSMQVKQLEGNVGLPLFEHLGKKIYLTEAGTEIFRCGRAVAQQLAETEQTIAELKGVERGQLAVAVASTVNYFAPRLLAGFSQRYPGVHISLSVTNREGLLRKLDGNESDVVLMGQPPPELELAAEPFMLNPLVVIAPPDHPLTRARRIPLTRLQNETFLLREPGSGTRIAMERFFAERGIVIDTGMEMNTNEAIKQGVEAGLGLGIVSLHTVGLELEMKRLAILNVQAFPIERQWYVVRRQGKRLSRAAQVFKDYVLNEAASLSGDVRPGR